jgi:plastocyanin
MRGSRLARLLVVCLVLGLVAAACSSKETPSSGGTTESRPSASESEHEGGKITIGSDQANDHGSKDFTGKDEAEVEVDSFYFEPTVVKGSAGQQIKLELDNESDTLHNFTLEDQSIDQDIQPGQKEDVTVTLPQSGILEFFCKFHRSSGMVGELSV